MGPSSANGFMSIAHLNSCDPLIVCLLMARHCCKHITSAITLYPQYGPVRWVLLSSGVVWMMVLMMLTFAKSRVPYWSTWIQRKAILCPHSLVHICEQVCTCVHKHSHTSHMALISYLPGCPPRSMDIAGMPLIKKNLLIISSTCLSGKQPT